MSKQLADKVIDGIPNGDGTFMGVNLREFSKKQLIKIMCMDHEAAEVKIKDLKADLYAISEMRYVSKPENGFMNSIKGL